MYCGLLVVEMLSVTFLIFYKPSWYDHIIVFANQAVEIVAMLTLNPFNRSLAALARRFDSLMLSVQVLGGLLSMEILSLSKLLNFARALRLDIFDLRHYLLIVSELDAELIIVVKFECIVVTSGLIIVSFMILLAISDLLRDLNHRQVASFALLGACKHGFSILIFVLP